MKPFLFILFLLASCTENYPVKTTMPDTRKTTEIETQKLLSVPTNTLNGKTETLALQYIVWGCACANWITPNDFQKYQDSALATHCIFIEPASINLKCPIYFDPSRHYIKVSGQFYIKPDYPKGTIQVEEHLEKGKVFHYTNIDIFEKDIEYPAKNDTTLTLSYQAIACPCPQWAEDHVHDEELKDHSYYLEPASDKLIKADTLFDDLNLPVKILVTGQVVTESGYPWGFNYEKGGKGGKVFRYTKLKILQRN